MKIIFCSSPLNSGQADPDYQSEYDSAVKNDIETRLINFEALLGKDISKALQKIDKAPELETAIFRGWMLKPENYELLYHGLKKNNLILINNPQEYVNCHYFPESYKVIREHTPKSIWLELQQEVNFEQLYENLKVFNGKPLIIKDYVKSQKHKWKDACYIDSSDNDEEVKRVVSNFLSFQGTDFNKGLVFREFCELEPIGEHSKSKMPLTREYRLFFLKGKLLEKYQYWDEGEYPDEFIDTESFKGIINKIRSNFFTVDIAKTKDGRWLIIELGDGQVAGLPDNADLEMFYQKIKEQNIK